MDLQDVLCLAVLCVVVGCCVAGWFLCSARRVVAHTCIIARKAELRTRAALTVTVTYVGSEVEVRGSCVRRVDRAALIPARRFEGDSRL